MHKEQVITYTFLAILAQKNSKEQVILPRLSDNFWQHNPTDLKRTGNFWQF